MSCDVVPWCTIVHEHTLGGDWETGADGAPLRCHEHAVGALVYLIAVERITADGVTVSPPRVSVNGEDEQLELPDARALAADLLQLAMIADRAA